MKKITIRLVTGSNLIIDTDFDALETYFILHKVLFSMMKDTVKDVRKINIIHEKK